MQHIMNRRSFLLIVYMKYSILSAVYKKKIYRNISHDRLKGIHLEGARSGSCSFSNERVKKHRQATYGRCVKRKLNLQERLSISFFFVEALGEWLVAALHAIEFEERIIQAVADLLEFFLFSHHLICKHSQCYRQPQVGEASSTEQREKGVSERRKCLILLISRQAGTSDRPSRIAVKIIKFI